MKNVFGNLCGDTGRGNGVRPAAVVSARATRFGSIAAMSYGPNRHRGRVLTFSQRRAVFPLPPPPQPFASYIVLVTSQRRNFCRRRVYTLAHLRFSLRTAEAAAVLLSVTPLPHHSIASGRARAPLLSRPHSRRTAAPP